jgi:hypothetical protein
MINIDQRRRENRTEEQRKAQTAAAIASRKNLPPARERSLQNQLKVFDWIYKWGYSSSPIIQQLLEKKSSNFTTVATRKNWLIKSATQSGMPNFYYTLSPPSLDTATTHSLENYEYPEIEPWRVNQDLIKHQLLAQKITLNRLQSGRISDYLTERMINTAGDKLGVKRPDVVFLMKDLKIGVEIELSSKWGRKLDQFFMGIKSAFENGLYDGFFIYAESPKLIERYQIALNKPLTSWKKDDRGHWVAKEKIAFPAKFLKSVRFELVKG